MRSEFSSCGRRSEQGLAGALVWVGVATLGWVAMVGCGGSAAPVSNSGVVSAGSGAAVVATPATLGNTKPVFQIGTCYLAGQPQVADFAHFKAAGVRKVISIRDPSEIAWDEQAAVEAAGLEFVQIPLGSPDQMTDEHLQTLCSMLRDAEKQEDVVVLHCGAAVRAAAVWMAYHCTEAEGTWDESERVVDQVIRVPDAWKTPVKKFVQETATRKSS